LTGGSASGIDESRRHDRSVAPAAGSVAKKQVKSRKLVEYMTTEEWKAELEKCAN
jgi:hypothetical protein